MLNKIQAAVLMLLLGGMVVFMSNGYSSKHIKHQFDVLTTDDTEDDTEDDDILYFVGNTTTEQWVNIAFLHSFSAAFNSKNNKAEIHINRQHAPVLFAGRSLCIFYRNLKIFC